MTDSSNSVERVRAALLSAGHAETIAMFPDGTRAASDAGAAIGAAVGGVAPVGHLSPLRALIDEDLMALDPDLGHGRLAAPYFPHQRRRNCTGYEGKYCRRKESLTGTRFPAYQGKISWNMEGDDTPIRPDYVMASVRLIPSSGVN